MESSDWVYNISFFAHILAVIVGIGSTFVWPMLGSMARKNDDPAARYAITHASFEASKRLSTPFIILAGLTGFGLVSAANISFKSPWIHAASALWLAAVLFALFVHTPNLKKMDALAATLAAGGGTPNPAGGPPAEVAELTQRGKRAGMYGGILHLASTVLIILMIWKPGGEFKAVG